MGSFPEFESGPGPFGFGFLMIYRSLYLVIKKIKELATLLASSLTFSSETLLTLTPQQFEKLIKPRIKL